MTDRDSPYATVYKKLKRAALREKFREVTVNELSGELDIAPGVAKTFARYAIIELAHEEIFYYRRWAKEKGKKNSVRAWKANSGSKEDEAEALADLDRDVHQAAGRVRNLNTRVQCGERTKLLTPTQGKSKKFILLSDSHLKRLKK
jgi:hypothetical protein